MTMTQWAQTCCQQLSMKHTTTEDFIEVVWLRVRTPNNYTTSKDIIAEKYKYQF
jgi:hypothetical protein